MAVPAMRLCGGAMEVPDPQELLLGYIEPGAGYGYPGYDRLVTNGSVALVDGDLLAPVLLNAHVDSARFAALETMFPALAAVGTLPPVALQDATDADLGAVAALFAPLDRLAFSGSGVRGTIVAKVLHRKRPDLVPLYDRRIFRAYVTNGPLDVAEEGPSEEFMLAFCRQLRADLRDEADAFAALPDAARAAGADLTRLRILDILVWRTVTAAR